MLDYAPRTTAATLLVTAPDLGYYKVYKVLLSVFLTITT